MKGNLYMRWEFRVYKKKGCAHFNNLFIIFVMVSLLSASKEKGEKMKLGLIKCRNDFLYVTVPCMLSHAKSQCITKDTPPCKTSTVCSEMCFTWLPARCFSGCSNHHPALHSRLFEVKCYTKYTSLKHLSKKGNLKCTIAGKILQISANKHFKEI